MKSNTLTGKARENLMNILSHALEEEAILSATMRGVLNNITGPNVHSLYRLFGDQCRQIDRWLGEISARARAFGIVVRAGAGEIARSAQDTLGSRSGAPARNLIGELLGQHEGIAQRLRTDLAACSADAATAELIKRLVEFHETTAWMLRMVLDEPEVPHPSV